MNLFDSRPMSEYTKSDWVWFTLACSPPLMIMGTALAVVLASLVS